MKRQMLVTVRGTSFDWVFVTMADPSHLAAWQADGLEVYECIATVPAWAAALGLAKIFYAAQRAWQWLRVW